MNKNLLPLTLILSLFSIDAFSSPREFFLKTEKCHTVATGLGAPKHFVRESEPVTMTCIESAIHKTTCLYRVNGKLQDGVTEFTSGEDGGVFQMFADSAYERIVVDFKSRRFFTTATNHLSDIEAFFTKTCSGSVTLRRKS